MEHGLEGAAWDNLPMMTEAHRAAAAARFGPVPSGLLHDGLLAWIRARFKEESAVPFDE